MRVEAVQDLPGTFYRVSPKPIPDVSNFVRVRAPDYGRIWDQSCSRQLHWRVQMVTSRIGRAKQYALDRRS
jgi:hypothetical protein